MLLDDGGNDGVDMKKHNLYFAHGDVLSAKSFDPFTHVYMFDIGEYTGGCFFAKVGVSAVF